MTAPTKPKLIRSYSREAVHEICARAQQWSFGDLGRIRQWADTFIAAHTTAPGGLSLEIGTWKGGTALVLCELLELLYHARSRPMLFTIDPYGDKPYNGGDWPEKQPLYGDTEYVTAKTLLAPYPHHAHYLFASHDALQTLGKSAYWWRGVARAIEQLTFVLIDGEHDAGSIHADLSAVLPLMHPHGTIVVDNIDNDPRTMPVLMKMDGLFGLHVQIHTSEALAGQQWAVLSRP